MSALPSAVQNPQEPASVNDAFLKFLPAVQRHASISFRDMHPTDREEAVAEATAAAFVNFKAISRRGAASVVTPSTLAQFAVLQRPHRERSCDHTRPTPVESTRLSHAWEDL